MILKVNGRQSNDYLLLGVQTNVGDTVQEALKKALAWKPKRAKSFTIDIQHTSYSGARVSEDKETGYATVEVRYFSKISEGKHVCLTDVK